MLRRVRVVGTSLGSGERAVADGHPKTKLGDVATVLGCPGEAIEGAGEPVVGVARFNSWRSRLVICWRTARRVASVCRAVSTQASPMTHGQRPQHGANAERYLRGRTIPVGWPSSWSAMVPMRSAWSPRVRVRSRSPKGCSFRTRQPERSIHQAVPGPARNSGRSCVQSVGLLVTVTPLVAGRPGCECNHRIPVHRQSDELELANRLPDRHLAGVEQRLDRHVCISLLGDGSPVRFRVTRSMARCCASL